MFAFPCACMLCHDSKSILSQIIYNLKYFVHERDIHASIVFWRFDLAFRSHIFQIKHFILQCYLPANKPRIATHMGRERQKVIVNSIKMLAKTVCMATICEIQTQSFSFYLFANAFFFLSFIYEFDFSLV